MARARLLFVEDHVMVAQGFMGQLEKDYEILGLVQRGDEAPKAIAAARPDVVLLDLTLPKRSGMQLIPEIRQISPKSKILVVTMHTDEVLVRHAFLLGAAGYMPKNCEIAELRLAITTVLSGNYYRSPRLAVRNDVDDDAARQRAYWQLTPQERRILRAMADGHSSEAIAENMGVSVHTVYFHRRNMRKTLGIDSEDGLAKFAVLAPHEDEETEDPHRFLSRRKL